MPCYAKSTPFKGIPARLRTLFAAADKVRRREGGGVAGKNSLILGETGVGHSPSRRV